MSDVVGADASAWHRLFTAPALRAGGPMPPLWAGAGAAPGVLALDGCMLRVAPFRIERWGQVFISAEELRIDLRALAGGRHRLVAAHDFRVEDRNPDLDRARAAVFVAERTAGRWQEAEDRPLECRTLAILGEIEVRIVDGAVCAALRTP